MSEQPELSAKKKKTPVQLGCMSWPAIALTIAIIGIRAFQPDAEPMSQWSVWSWFLMCLPVMLPVLLWAAFVVIAVVGTFIYEVCK